jgi:hypothetical protein
MKNTLSVTVRRSQAAAIGRWLWVRHDTRERTVRPLGSDSFLEGFVNYLECALADIRRLPSLIRRSALARSTIQPGTRPGNAVIAILNACSERFG